MRIPSLKGRGLRPSTIAARLRRRLDVPDISRPRLRRFLAEMGRSPVPAMPSTPPSTIAVVVPCYRHATYAPRALESVLRQTRRPDELILVEDHSPDGTLELLRRFAADHPWPNGGPVVLANASNLGQAASLNRAIGEARSDLVMILNDDDCLMDDAVETALSFFERRPDLALLGGPNVIFTNDADLETASKSALSYTPAGVTLRVHQPDEVAGYRRGPGFDMTHSATTFRRPAWQAVGGYEPDKRRRVVPHSDRDFQLRVNALWPVAILDCPLSFWRRGSSVDAGRNS